jgi:hypothetical protein
MMHPQKPLDISIEYKEPHTILQSDPMNINYFGPPGTFQQISLLDVISGRYPQTFFQGKIILVGVTTPGLEERLVQVGVMRDMEGNNIVSGRNEDTVIFDVPGELQAFYKIATCVLAGGSFSNKDLFIHVIGPVSAGTPVILGPHLGSDPGVARLFVDHKAAIQIQPPGLLKR